MQMGLRDLEREGSVRQIPPDPIGCNHALERAEHDLGTARCVQGIDLDWALAIAYDAGLQACLSVMLHQGYRPRGFDRHRTAIRFARLVVPMIGESIDALDDIRLRRHSVVYDIRGSVSEGEAVAAIETAEHILFSIREWLRADGG